MKIEYSITSKKNLKNLEGIIFITVSLLLGYQYCIFKQGEDSSSFFLNWILGIFFILFLSTFIIHLSYYLSNKRNKLVYDTQDLKIEFNYAKDKKKSFFLDDIILLEKHMTFPHSNKYTGLSPNSNYNYSIIHLKDGTRFFVTSLMMLDWELPEPKKTIIKRHFFAPVIWKFWTQGKKCKFNGTYIPDVDPWYKKLKYTRIGKIIHEWTKPTDNAESVSYKYSYILWGVILLGIILFWIIF